MSIKISKVAPPLLACMLLVALPINAIPKGNAQNLEPRYGGTLVSSIRGDPRHFLQQITGGQQMYPSANLYERLVEFNATSQLPIPATAKSWEVSPDGLVYTFHLFDDIKFHDGEPLTSADVKYTLDGIIERKYIAYKWIKIIDKIETPDDYTVVITLQAPQASFLLRVAGRWSHALGILPKHIYEPGPYEWSENPHAWDPIGSGPFKFVRFVSGQYVMLEAFDDYHFGRPYLDRVIYKILPDSTVAMLEFKQGNIDVLGEAGARVPSVDAFLEVKDLPNVIAITPYQHVEMLAFNQAIEPFNNKLVRQAIAYAIDRDEISEVIFRGTAAPGINHFGRSLAWAQNPDVKFSYDPDKAETLLDEAGYPRGSDGVRFRVKLTIQPVRYPNHPDMADLIKGYLQRVGIEITEYVSVTYEVYLLQVVGESDFEMDLDALYMPVDPTWITDKIGTGGFYNHINSPPEVQSTYDDLLAKAELDFDREKRKPYYYQLQEIMMDEMPYVNLVDRSRMILYNAEFHDFNLRGVNDYSLVWWEGGEEPTPATPVYVSWLPYIAVVVAICVISIGVLYWIRRKKR